MIHCKITDLATELRGEKNNPSQYHNPLMTRLPNHDTEMTLPTSFDYTFDYTTIALFNVVKYL